MEISPKVNDMIFNQVKSGEQIIVSRAMEKLNEIKEDYRSVDLSNGTDYSGNHDKIYGMKVIVSQIGLFLGLTLPFLYFDGQISRYSKWLLYLDICLVIFLALNLYIIHVSRLVSITTATKMPLVYNKNLSSTDEYRLKMIIENPKIQSQHDAFHNVINWIIGIPLLKLPTEIVERDLVTSYNKISYLGDFNSLFELEKAQAVLLKTFKDKL